MFHVEQRAADTDRLVELYADGSLDAREELVRRHMPVARRLASRYRGSSEPREDLEQVAYLGLLKTVDRFDPSAGVFLSYLVTTIRGELKRHFRDHGWTVTMSRPVQERCLLVTAAGDKLTVRNGHAPTVRELAAETGLATELVIEALDAASGYTPLSLDAPVGADPGESASALVDTVGQGDQGYASAELRAAITPIVDRLPDRERRILRMRFVEDRTQSDIAAACGLSQMHVSRLLRSTLTRLLESADPDALAAAGAA